MALLVRRLLQVRSMGSGTQRGKNLQVTVIAESRETIDGLHAYLQGAGVTSRTTRVLGDMAKVPAAVSAVVVFPDEFDAKDVVSRIRSLRAHRPRTLVVVVTSSPQRFRPALDPDALSLLPIVLPKPAFGWSILDAIRDHAHPDYQ